MKGRIKDMGIVSCSNLHEVVGVYNDSFDAHAKAINEVIKAVTKLENKVALRTFFGGLLFVVAFHDILNHSYKIEKLEKELEELKEKGE